MLIQKIKYRLNTPRARRLADYAEYIALVGKCNRAYSEMDLAYQDICLGLLPDEDMFFAHACVKERVVDIIGCDAFTTQSECSCFKWDSPCREKNCSFSAANHTYIEKLHEYQDMCRQVKAFWPTKYSQER